MSVAIMSPSVWISKNLRYETPYCVTGTIKLTGSEQAPTDIWTDRNIGTWEAVNTNRKDSAVRCCSDRKNRKPVANTGKPTGFPLSG